MFDDFRKSVKDLLASKKLTYLQLSKQTGLATSTIKCFMCGANNSRRIAEKIADALDLKMVYQNDKYTIEQKIISKVR